MIEWNCGGAENKESLGCHRVELAMSSLWLANLVPKKHTCTIFKHPRLEIERNSNFKACTFIRNCVVCLASSLEVIGRQT